MREMEEEKREQNIFKGGSPNVEAEDGCNAAGRVRWLFGSRLRVGLMRRGFLLYGPDVVDVITAHRRAECPNRKNDLIAYGEGDGFQDVSRDERCEHVSDGEGDVACAGNSRTEPNGNCLCE